MQTRRLKRGHQTLLERWLPRPSDRGKPQPAKGEVAEASASPLYVLPMPKIDRSELVRRTSNTRATQMTAEGVGQYAQRDFVRQPSDSRLPGALGRRGGPRRRADPAPQCVRQRCATWAWRTKPSRRLSDQLLAGDHLSRSYALTSRYDLRPSPTCPTDIVDAEMGSVSQPPGWDDGTAARRCWSCGALAPMRSSCGVFLGVDNKACMAMRGGVSPNTPLSSKLPRVARFLNIPQDVRAGNQSDDQCHRSDEYVHAWT